MPTVMNADSFRSPPITPRAPYSASTRTTAASMLRSTWGRVQLPSDGQDGLQQAVQAVPSATDGVDAYLQLAQQFVEAELRQMRRRTPTVIRAHRFSSAHQADKTATSSPALTGTA